MEPIPADSRVADVNAARWNAPAAGGFFLIAAAAAIAGLVLYTPVLGHTGDVFGAGADTRIALGALFELLAVISVIGTGVTRDLASATV
jgi:hypothetical protein